MRLRIPRPRFRLRTLLIAVAVVAVAMAGTLSLHRRRQRHLATAARQAVLLSAAESTSRLGVPLPVADAENVGLTPSELAQESVPGRARARASYRAAMRAKYERAARFPWLPVEPDPPPPE